MHPNVTLKFLGAGGAFSRRYGTTCSMLTLGEGRKWLIDCGRQAPDQLHEAGIRWHEIVGQLVTHVHGDHTHGLEDFAFSRYFMSGDVPSIREGGPRPLLVCHSAVRKELWESLAPSLRYVPEPQAPTSGSLETYFEPHDPLCAEAPGSNPWPRAERFAVEDGFVTATETVHVPGKPSTALTLDFGPAQAWWSGDSTVDAELLIALEPATNLFFHDCTFIEYPGQVHGAFGELERLPEVVRRKIVLMHHEDDLDTHRQRALGLGFRIAMPGQTYDLVSGELVE